MSETTPAALRAEALTALQKPGAKRIRLLGQLDVVDQELRPLVLRALDMEVPQRAISEATGLSRNTIAAWKRAQDADAG